MNGKPATKHANGGASQKDRSSITVCLVHLLGGWKKAPMISKTKWPPSLQQALCVNYSTAGIVRVQKRSAAHIKLRDANQCERVLPTSLEMPVFLTYAVSTSF